MSQVGLHAQVRPVGIGGGRFGGARRRVRGRTRPARPQPGAGRRAAGPAGGNRGQAAAGVPGRDDDHRRRPGPARGAVGEVAAATAGLQIRLLITGTRPVHLPGLVGRRRRRRRHGGGPNCRAGALLAHAFLPGPWWNGAAAGWCSCHPSPPRGSPGLAVYSASKAFLVSLGQALWAGHTAGRGRRRLVPGRGASPPATSRRVPASHPRELCPRPRSRWPRWTRSATASDHTAGWGEQAEHIPAGARLLPRRTAIAVFSRATAAALNEPSGARTDQPTTELPAAEGSSTRY